MANEPVDGWTPLLDAMKALRTEWPRRGWSWDARFSCVSSSFNADIEPQARAIALKTFPTEWLSTTLAQAPPYVRDVAQKSGGLRPGQLLLAGPPMGRAFAFGLWWPWGDATTISLRVGIGGTDPREDVLNRFRDAFGVEL
jgi:hypothetical protein